MMHSFEGLADEISTLLKNRGDTGDRGDNSQNVSEINAVSVTPRYTPLSPLKIEGCRPLQSRGDSKNALDQSLTSGVTRVTPVTRNFEQDRKATVLGVCSDQSYSLDAGLPPSWIDGLAHLRVMEIPDCFSSERWRYIVDDADAFLKQWGATAANLDWSIHDLFGAHPAAPAVRFDAMGLILLLHGDQVIALTETTATIRTMSGSIQRFNRSHKIRGALLWEIER